MEEIQNELQDLRQKEQTSRVLQEKTSSRLQRLRSRVIQAVYTAPGSIKPEARLDDSEILNAVQKVILQRNSFSEQINFRKLL